MQNVMEHAPTQPATLMSVAQVAIFLDLSKSKVYQLIREEGLPVIAFGRALRISFESLQVWLTAREKRSLH